MVSCPAVLDFADAGNWCCYVGPMSALDSPYEAGSAWPAVRSQWPRAGGSHSPSKEALCPREHELKGWDATSAPSQGLHKCSLFGWVFQQGDPDG